MIIITKSIKIPITNVISKDYFETYFKSMNLNVIRWAINDIVDNNYIVDAALVLEH